MPKRPREAPRDYIEWLNQPAGVLRLGGDGVTFEAAVAFDVENGVATIKGGVALGKSTKAVTRAHLRRGHQVLKSHGLKVRWVHKNRERFL